MKLLLTICLTLLSNAAFAEERPLPIGTKCIYQGRANLTGQYEEITFTVTLLSRDEQGVGRLKSSIRTRNGKSSEAEYSVKMNTMLEIEKILTDCQNNHGVLETIKVAAGIYETCKMYLEGYGYNWIGKVPFASVKVELDVRPMQFELKKCVLP